MHMTNTLSKNAEHQLKHAVGLSAVWEKCMSEVYGPDCRSLVGREHGQLGKLKKSLGMKQATEVVEYAIHNWSKFARKAATNVGSDIVPPPPKPTVGWLYQYHAMAVLMLHEDLQSIAKKQAEEEQAKKEAQAKEEAKAAVQIAAKAVHEVEHKPATLEEVEAIEAEVEAEWAAKENLGSSAR